MPKLRESDRSEDILSTICIAVFSTPKWSLTILQVSIFGLITNGLPLYITLKSPRFQNAFGILCKCFLLCNIQNIVVLCLWESTVLCL
ncbi:unnamed protein product [Gongylonema pulchrum]|uniref:7TM_GPCR_Srx domain-containing protein n=1 Tax=Gongylonema pulchrum TaxID=637853 RepID=A0A183EBG3_9BILA|nr:unnamed protein product [Gongylonema pulchrum]